MEQAVLVFLQTTIKMAIEFQEMLHKINASSTRRKESTHLQRTLMLQQAERDKCMRAMADLYPDWKSGVISQEEYLIIKAKLNEKVAALDAMIANLRKTAEEYEAGVTDENEFITHFIKYKNIDRLTRPMLVELVKEILVYEGGRIEVTLNFQDAYQQVADYIEMNKEAIASA